MLLNIDYKLWNYYKRYILNKLIWHMSPTRMVDGIEEKDNLDKLGW